MNFFGKFFGRCVDYNYYNMSLPTTLVDFPIHEEDTSFVAMFYVYE
jgi:hypothetical protein